MSLHTVTAFQSLLNTCVPKLSELQGLDGTEEIENFLRDVKTFCEFFSTAPLWAFNLLSEEYVARALPHYQALLRVTTPKELEAWADASKDSYYEGQQRVECMMVQNFLQGLEEFQRVGNFDFEAAAKVAAFINLVESPDGTLLVTPRKRSFFKLLSVLPLRSDCGNGSMFPALVLARTTVSKLNNNKQAKSPAFIRQQANLNCLLGAFLLMNEDVDVYAHLLDIGALEEITFLLQRAQAYGSNVAALKRYGLSLNLPIITRRQFLEMSLAEYEYYSGLDEDVKSAIRAYGGNVLYGDINGYLREGPAGIRSGSDPDELDKTIQLIDSALESDKLPRFPFPLIAYRAIDLHGYGDALSVATALSDPAYKSLSLNPNVSMYFCRLLRPDGRPPNCLLLQVTIPAGTPIFKDFKGTNSESEIILPRKATFLMTGRGFDVYGKNGFVLHVLPVTVKI